MENSRFQFRAWQPGLKKMTYFNSPFLTFEMPEAGKRQIIPILAFKVDALGNFRFAYISEGTEEEDEE